MSTSIRILQYVNYLNDCCLFAIYVLFFTLEDHHSYEYIKHFNLCICLYACLLFVFVCMNNDYIHCTLRLSLQYSFYNRLLTELLMITSFIVLLKTVLYIKAF